MKELWLKYKDPDGEERRVEVNKERFAVGRHSENDLSISDSRLSREHIWIERKDDDFIVSDRGSSNGTELNGERIFEPAKLKEGDRLDLGGLEVELEFVSAGSPDAPAAGDLPEAEAAAPIVAATPAPRPAAPEPGGIPTSFFIIAPIFAIVILGIIGLVVVMSGGKGEKDNSNFVYSDDTDDPPKGRKDRDTNSVIPTNRDSNEVVSTSPSPTSSNGTNTSTPGPNLTETGKAEQNAAAFLRRIAQNDPRAFITGEQAQIVNAKIKSISGSSALADNINSARKSSSQIKALAASKNLKPQFLAVAAITKLGNSRGDVLQTAQSMADVIDKLGTQVGNELGDDCLVMMAAYGQGAAGDFMKMRNMLQDLATKMPESSRAIRTIWFLKKNGKITDAEYDFALRFLATGAITQNPKDFGVNAEALTL